MEEELGEEQRRTNWRTRIEQQQRDGRDYMDTRGVNEEQGSTW